MRPFLLLLLCVLLPGPALPADVAGASGKAAGAADERPLRLPLVRLHGAALAGAERRLHVDELDRLAPATTWRIWDPYRLREAEYTGMTLADLVKAVAPGATRVRMRAVNDYNTVFTAREWQTLPILLATRDGGERMAVAAKGPARIVYRQTRENEMAMQVHAPKWIWQVTDVEFLAE